MYKRVFVSLLDAAGKLSRRHGLAGMLERIAVLAGYTLVIICFVGFFTGAVGILFPYWSDQFYEEIEMDEGRIAHEKDHAYLYIPSQDKPHAAIVPRPTDWNVKVFEDGVLLARNDNHDDIRKNGNGQFSYWGTAVYFSSTDNSSPRSNGRRYQIKLAALWPLTLYRYSALVLSGVLFVGSAFLLAIRMSERSEQGASLGKIGIFPLVLASVVDAYIIGVLLLGWEGAPRPHYILAVGLSLVWISAVFWDGYSSVRNFTHPSCMHRACRAPLSTRIYEMLNSSFVVVALVLVAYGSSLALGFPIAYIGYDTPGYLLPVMEVLRGGEPLFIGRPAGYPLFIYGIVAVGGSLHLVVVSQSVFLAMALGFFAAALRLLMPRFAFLGALGVSIYAISPGVQRYAPQLMSEALYVSMLLTGFGFLILAYIKDKRYLFVLSSVCHAYVILTKPNGMYLIVIYAIVCLHLGFAGWPRSRLWAYALPFIMILLTQFSYNYFTLHTFGVSAFTEQAMIGTVGTHMTTSHSYPSFLNAAIEKHVETIEPSDVERLRESWDYVELHDIFLKYFRDSVRGEDSVMKYLVRNGYAEDYMDTRKYLGMIIRESIRNEPLLYFKLVYSVFLTEMFSYMHTGYTAFDQYMRDIEFMNESKRRIDRYEAFGNEWEGRPPTGWLYGEDAKIASEVLNDGYRTLRSTILFRLVFFGALMTAALRLALSRGDDRLSFLALVMLMSVVGAALVTGLAQVSLERYAFTHEIFMWVSPALLLSMIMTPMESRKRVFVNA